MKAKEGFYVQELSGSNKSEYPNNRPNCLKNRLPYPLRFPQRGWKLGLSSISIPNAKVNIYNVVKQEEFLFFMHAATYAPDDIHRLNSIADGVSFMKVMISFFEQRHILNYNGPTFGSKFVADSGKRLYVKFR